MQASLAPSRLLSVSSDALSLSVGQATRLGERARNEDYAGFVTPEHTELAVKGVVLALADGVSGALGGREAAEFTVRSLLADYYATPQTWEVPLSLEKVVAAINRWVAAHGAAQRELAGMACTLSALVLRGTRYYLGHVGDSRIYRLSQKECVQLTQDHVWDRPGMQHVLKRAVGLDQHLVMDYADGELQVGDLFLICSDGVWEPLGHPQLQQLLQWATLDPQVAADALVDAALRAGGKDNATALVARVDAVSSLNWRDTLNEGLQLPVPPPRLQPGQHVDEFQVLEQIHESRATLLYKVRSLRSGQYLVLKTLQRNFAKDQASCEGLLAEEWLAKRVVSPHFPQVVPIAPGARHFLYYVMTYHSGETLQLQLDNGKHFSSGEVATLGIQIAKGLGVLHRIAILHRDIKPSNLLFASDATLRILDLGVALAAGVPYPELSGNPGTPSFMAPELFDGKPASPQSDLYAAGVTLYHLLTRKYPYGEIEPFQHPKFGDPVPPTRYRPEIPSWLENLLLRAVARDPEARFETAEEFLLALERGDARPLPAPPRTPLLHGVSWRWRSVALISLVINVLLLYLFLATH